MFNFLSNKKSNKTKGRRGFYRIKPFNQIKTGDMKYAKDDVLYKNNGIEIFGRFHNDCLYKIIFVEKEAELEKLDFSNSFLKDCNAYTEFEFGFSLSAFAASKTITVIVFKNKNENTIMLSKKYCSISANEVTHSFVIDDETGNLEYYHYLPEYNSLNQELMNVLFFDLAAKECGV